MIEEVICPDCGGAMVSRANRRTGQRFWGCGNYPACKGTRNTDGDARYDSEPSPEQDEEELNSRSSERWRENDRGRWRSARLESRGGARRFSRKVRRYSANRVRLGC